MTSKTKVDNINKVSDDSNIIKKCGTTTTVGSGSGQTIVVDGATVTLGRCGGAVNLAPGATQTGFGQAVTGVEFCTTAKTSPFTAVSQKGYFVNTTSGGITVTLPASPSAGDIVAVKDYANTFDSNALTVGRNGSKIAGLCNDAVFNVEGGSISLVYVDATRGWLNIQTDNTVQASEFITATGGTITTCGNFRIHTFTSDGCFSVNAGTSAPNNVVSYVVVAGGGGGNQVQSGGGGAGGFREGKCSSDPYTDSPLDAGSGITVTTQNYPISVGAGGGGGGAPCGGVSPGSNSVFSTITSAGGGQGGASGGPEPYGTAASGGSGGGGGEQRCGNEGNTPPVSPPQGNPGGNSSNIAGAGGGGAGGSGSNTSGPNSGGNGGTGVSSSISGASVARAGGGGGGGSSSGSGGSGGGGAGNPGPGANPPANGTANTGGGGGAGYSGSGVQGGAGGSGVVILRYKFQ
jgi:hypothetical protein